MVEGDLYEGDDTTRGGGDRREAACNRTSSSGPIRKASNGTPWRAAAIAFVPSISRGAGLSRHASSRCKLRQIVSSATSP